MTRDSSVLVSEHTGLRWKQAVGRKDRRINLNASIFLKQDLIFVGIVSLTMALKILSKMLEEFHPQS